MKYFSFDKFEGDYEFFDTEKEAIVHTNAAMDHYLSEGIPEDMTYKVGYGEVTKSVVQSTIAEKKDFTDEEWIDEGYPSEFDFICRFDLVEESFLDDK